MTEFKVFTGALIGCKRLSYRLVAGGGFEPPTFGL